MALLYSTWPDGEVTTAFICGQISIGLVQTACRMLLSAKDMCHSLRALTLLHRYMPAWHVMARESTTTQRDLDSRELGHPVAPLDEETQ